MLSDWGPVEKCILQNSHKYTQSNSKVVKVAKLCDYGNTTQNIVNNLVAPRKTNAFSKTSLVEKT